MYDVRYGGYDAINSGCDVLDTRYSGYIVTCIVDVVSYIVGVMS